MTVNQCWAISCSPPGGNGCDELTTRDGVATPKQFCSLRGGRSLLGDACAGDGAWYRASVSS
jgi:hypothetical protein